MANMPISYMFIHLCSSFDILALLLLKKSIYKSLKEKSFLGYLISQLNLTTHRCILHRSSRIYLYIKPRHQVFFNTKVLWSFLKKPSSKQIFSIY